MENTLNKVPRLPLEYPVRQAIRIYFRRMLIFLTIAVLSLAILSPLTVSLNSINRVRSQGVQGQQQQVQMEAEHLKSPDELEKRNTSMQSVLTWLLYLLGICIAIIAVEYAFLIVHSHRVADRQVIQEKDIPHSKSE